MLPSPVRFHMNFAHTSVVYKITNCLQRKTFSSPALKHGSKIIITLTKSDYLTLVWQIITSEIIN